MVKHSSPLLSLFQQHVEKEEGVASATVWPGKQLETRGDNARIE